MALMGIMGTAAIAQPGRHHQRPKHYTVSFESQHDEVFSVFIDGNIMNRMPQNRVLVSDLTDQMHEVVVVLRRPTQKAAVLQLVPGEPNIKVTISYDVHNDAFILNTPSCNRAGEHEVPRPVSVVHPAVVPPPPVHPMEQPPHNPPYQEPVAVRHASDKEVDAMVARMRKQTFDSDRLALGKVIVASSDLTAGQVARLAETLEFTSSQVDFLKYAYPYCVDKANYNIAVDVLTFSSDKKKVMDYITSRK